ITRIPGVRVISLQYKDGLDQLAQLPPDAAIETLDDDFNRGPDAFVDTAAVISNLDLVISCCTAVAHLAGAMGRPAWVALKHVPAGGWWGDGDESPGYPGLRLFGQPARGDWTSVFARIERELHPLLDQLSAAHLPHR